MNRDYKSLLPRYLRKLGNESGLQIPPTALSSQTR